MKKTSTKKAINIFSALIIGCGASLGGASVMLAAAPPAAAAVAVIPEVAITNVTKPVVGDSPNTTVQVKVLPVRQVQCNGSFRGKTLPESLKMARVILFLSL